MHVYEYEQLCKSLRIFLSHLKSVRESHICCHWFLYNLEVLAEVSDVAISFCRRGDGQRLVL